MSNAFFPQRLTGHLLATPDLMGVVADVGGALFRRALEDPDNEEGVVGLVALPSAHRVTSIQQRGLRPATAAVGGVGPYALADGNTLLISVAGAPAQTITFQSADFAAIGAATRNEVVAAINAELVGARARAVRTAFCVHSLDEQNDSLQVTGGTAVAALGLDTLLHRPYPADDVAGYNWRVLATIEDDDVFPVLVFDPGFSVTSPCPALTAWSVVLG